MKKLVYIFLTASLLVALIVSTAAPQKRGIVPVPIKDRSGKQVFLYQESHALLVGVSEYSEGWSNLPGVRKDLKEVQTALEQKGFNTIVVNNPTRNELRDSIENFINEYGQAVDNRLIFYFAGHGHTLKSSYGEEMGYFVPADAPNPSRDKSGFLTTSIDMQLIEVYSKQVQSKHALFLFDSCFSGSLFSLSRAIPENISYKTSKPVRQFITAGSADETVPDKSIFNDQFIRALNGEGDVDGDGYLTGVELGEFLNKTVINYTKGSQHPQYGKIRNPHLDKGDFVFSLLDTRNIEESIDSIVKQREKLEQKRLSLAEKRIAALQLMEEEKQKLEDEKRRLREEQARLARLQPDKRKTNPKQYDKALSAYRSRNYDESILLLQDLDLRNPPIELKDNIAFWIGSNYTALGMYDDAILQFEKVVNNFPGGSKVHYSRYMLGLTYYKKGEPGRATEVWEDALRMNPPAEVGIKIRAELKPFQASFAPSISSKAKSSKKCPDKMSLIPGGEFLEYGLFPKKIDTFCMDKYEVTQAEYESLRGNNPSYFKGPNRPVEQVNWYEAEEYCQKLGKRLPTEWEWEKAAKAGTTTKYYWGDDVGVNNANCGGCGRQWSDKETSSVGSFAANKFGLHDMFGNVWEWTNSSSNNYVGHRKIIRGGSWNSNLDATRTIQSRSDPKDPSNNIGFRCAR